MDNKVQDGIEQAQKNRKGFILSRQWKDEPWRGPSGEKSTKLVLYYWLKTENGPAKAIFHHEEAVFFVAKHQAEAAKAILSQLANQKKIAWRSRPVNLKNFAYEEVEAFYFLQQRAVYFAREELTKQGISPLEADIQPTDRYLMERFITGSLTINGEGVKRRGVEEYTNPQLSKVEYSPELLILSLDIETSMDGEKLYSIAACVDHYVPGSYDSAESVGGHLSPQTQCVFMVGNEQEQEELVFCRDERALLNRFIAWYHEQDPDIIVGWSVINFDLRFLQRKADALGVRLSLGRQREAIEWRKTRDNDQHFTLVLPGRAVLDGIDTLKSATFVFESFSLQSVSNELLQRGKLIHDVDNRGDEITRLFLHDKQALARYNLEDCRLVLDIFQTTRLVDFALERANMTGLALDRFGGSVAAFDNRYLPRLHRKGFVAPILKTDPEGIGSPGGYVMDSIPGIYQNVLVLDFKSLYPSIIRTFHVDPLALCVASHERGEAVERSLEETKVDDHVNYIAGFNSAAFHRASAILPELIGELWQERDRAKRENNQAMSQAIKILMNSFYGVLGTPGCRFFDFRLPSSITLRGHQILTTTKTLVEEHGHQVIYGDTDSLFVCLQNIDDDLPVAKLFEIGEKLAESLNKWWNEYLSEHHQIRSHLELEFETCFAQFLMPTIRGTDKGSKKRYAGKRALRDGSIEEEIVFKGLEAVRTDWTKLARSFQRELYRRIFNNEDYEGFIRQTVADVYAGKCDDALVYRKRLRRRLEDYQRNIPPHVQAALKAEGILKQRKEKSRYQRGGWIQYVMTLQGPEPLEFRQSPLDYELYVERQILPIVDGIVHFLGSSFDEIAGQQLDLF